MAKFAEARLSPPLRESKLQAPVAFVQPTRSTAACPAMKCTSARNKRLVTRVNAGSSLVHYCVVCKQVCVCLCMCVFPDMVYPPLLEPALLHYHS